MEKTTEIDRTLSYIVEQLDYCAVNSKHSIKKNGEYYVNNKIDIVIFSCNQYNNL